MLRIAPSATLAALVLALVPAASAETDLADAWDGCVQYAYVADYHWYWACVAPKDLSCPVYLKERHGMTYSKECVVESDAAIAAPGAGCVPTSGGLDYPSYLCYDPSDPKCPVYHLSSSDRGVTKTCIPPL